MRKYFVNNDYEQSFSQNGYVKTKILDHTDTDILINLFHELNGDKKLGFYASLFESDYNLKKTIDEAIKKVVAEKVLAIFKDFKPVIASFVVKFPGDTGLVHPHQDWTFVDEKKYTSINVWMPLKDTTRQNGTLHLLPGSHKLPFTYRGTNVVSAIVGAPRVPLSSMLSFDMLAGEALIYDHRMIHASPPNLSDSIRYGVALVVIPEEADNIHIARINGKYFEYRIDKDFFYRQMCVDDYNMKMPEGYMPVRELEYKEYAFSNKMLFPVDTILRRIKRHFSAGYP